MVHYFGDGENVEGAFISPLKLTVIYIYAKKRSERRKKMLCDIHIQQLHRKNLVTDFQNEFMVSTHINMDKINSVLTKIIHTERSFAISKSELHSKKLQISSISRLK